MPKSRAPRHLRRATRAWWNSVLRDYELDPHHVYLLTLAGECLDREAQAREAIEKDGPYHKNRHGELKPHPALQTERDCKALFARLVRELNLDANPAPESRPPLLGHYRNGDNDATEL